MDQPIVVAIVNTNPDLVRMLQIAIEQAGFVTFVWHVDDIRKGATDIEPLLRQHDPKVVVYDVAPPFEQNWRFLEHLRTATAFAGRRFVLTTVNIGRLQEIVGLDETVYEIVGRASEIDQVVRAVKEASRARPTH
jgi:hypothetical protein